MKLCKDAWWTWHIIKVSYANYGWESWTPCLFYEKPLKSPEALTSCSTLLSIAVASIKSNGEKESPYLNPLCIWKGGVGVPFKSNRFSWGRNAFINPWNLLASETHCLQDINNETPLYGIISFVEIKFQEGTRLFSLPQPPYNFIGNQRAI